MPIATIHEAKTNLSKLIQMAERGEDIVIARGNRPVVRIVAIEPPAKKRTLGMFRHDTKIGPEFFEPLPPEELAAWWGEDVE